MFGLLNQSLLWSLIVAACSLQPVMTSSMESDDDKSGCRLRRIIHTIDYKDCTLTRLPSFACQGTCSSYAQISAKHEGQMERHCNCCQELAVAEKNVTLFCGGPRATRLVQVRMLQPRSCMCRPCSSGVHVAPLELASIDDKRNWWNVL